MGFDENFGLTIIKWLFPSGILPVLENKTKQNTVKQKQKQNQNNLGVRGLHLYSSNIALAAVSRRVQYYLLVLPILTLYLSFKTMYITLS